MQTKKEIVIWNVQVREEMLQWPIPCCSFDMGVTCLALNSLRTCLFSWGEVFVRIRDSSQDYIQGRERVKMSLQRPKSQRAQDGDICAKVSNLTAYCVCFCACLLVVMICSQVKEKWMHLLMPSVSVCVSCMLNTQLIFAITGFSCGSTAGHKGQIEESGVTRLSSSPFS